MLHRLIESGHFLTERKKVGQLNSRLLMIAGRQSAVEQFTPALAMTAARTSSPQFGRPKFQSPAWHAGQHLSQYVPSITRTII